MRHLLLARAARQPAAQEIGPERDHRTVRFDREAAPRRRLVAGWHGRPAGVRMSGETAPTAQARAERQEQTARWVDRPRRQRRSRSAAAGIACRPDLRPPAGRRHAIRDATPGRLARTAHDGTLRCEPIRPGKDDRPYFEAPPSVRPKGRGRSRWLIRAAGLPFRLFPKNFEGWADDTITQMGVHATTHVDAPWHYGPTCGGQPAATIDQIPLDRCLGPGVVVDMRHKPDFEPITVADLEASLAASGAVLSERTIVLIRTGRDRFIEEPDYWKRGTGMSAAATEWLLNHGIVLMGIDQWGWDVPLLEQVRRAKADNDPEVFWAAHRAGQRRPFWHMEQLVNLGSLPSHGFTVAVFPLKLVGASAAPARVIAFVSSTAEDEGLLDTARTGMGQT